MEDLWPDIDLDVGMVTPVGVLREQAEQLGLKTGNVVEAVVRQEFSANGFAFSFTLYSSRYQYKLCTILFPAKLFPAVIKVENDSDGVAPDIATLEVLLRGLFANRQTTTIINALVAMTMEEGE